MDEKHINKFKNIEKEIICFFNNYGFEFNDLFEFIQFIEKHKKNILTNKNNDKIKCILDSGVVHKYPIYLSSNIKHFSDLRRMENFKNKVIYYKEVYTKYKNIYDNETLILDKSCDYIINKNNNSITDNKRRFYRKTITRSCYLYDNHLEILDKIYFNYNCLDRLNLKDWELWIKYLDIFIKNNYSDKEVPVLKSNIIYKYPIRLSSDIKRFNEIKSYEQLKNNIMYYSHLYNKYKNIYENETSTLENMIIYIIDNEKDDKGKKYKNTYNKKVYYRKLIKRCCYLYDNYLEIFDKLYFKHGILTIASESDWGIWVNYLNMFVNKNINKTDSEYDTADSDIE